MIGTAAIVDAGSPLDVGRLLLAIVVAASLHVAGVLLSDVFDHAKGTDKLARLDRSGIATGGLQLESGALRPTQVTAAAVVAIGLAVGSLIAIGSYSAYLFATVALVVVLQYAGPPLRLAYRGRGLGELALGLCYGVLPAAGAVAAQQDWGIPDAAWWGGGIVGALIAMAYASHHFLHFRADRAASKHSPVVAFGEVGALFAIGAVDIVAALALVLGVLTGALPTPSLLSLLAIPIVASAWIRASRDPLPQAYLRLIGAHLAASAIVTVAVTAALSVGGARLSEF